MVVPLTDFRVKVGLCAHEGELLWLVEFPFTRAVIAKSANDAIELGSTIAKAIREHTDCECDMRVYPREEPIIPDEVA